MNKHYSSGMTLVEAIVWVFTFTLVMLTLVSSLLYFYKTNRYVIQEALAIATMQRVVDTTVRTIRSASYSQIGAYPLVSMGPTQITFYASAIPNNPTIHQVRIFTIGTKLEQGITAPTGTPMKYTPSTDEHITFIGDYVQNGTVGTPLFHYFDTNGTEIVDYSRVQDVRYLTLNVVVDVSTTTAPNAISINASAALRNLINRQ
jgi:hypothetical protein